MKIKASTIITRYNGKPTRSYFVGAGLACACSIFAGIPAQRRGEWHSPIRIL